MNTKTFDFGEALDWINCDRAVTLTLNGLERIYYKDSSGDIICIPNRKLYLAYEVKEFKIDAVLSKDWSFIDMDIDELLDSIIKYETN